MADNTAVAAAAAAAAGPTPCSIAVESVFGPIVDASCLGGFDFTLFFEETILAIAPLGAVGMSFFSSCFVLKYPL